MNPRVCDISDTGFSNTCSSVHQRKPRGWRPASSLQIPSQNSRRWAKSKSGRSRPGQSRSFCGQQLAPTLAFFQHLNRSPTAAFPLWHILPSCLLSPGSPGHMVQGRLRGELPLKLWAAVPMSPHVAANAPQASLMCLTPCLPRAEKTRPLGGADRQLGLRLWSLKATIRHRIILANLPSRLTTTTKKIKRPHTVWGSLYICRK